MSNNKIVCINGMPYNHKDSEIRIVKSICNWNALRYKRVYDNELTLKLLNEEIEETDKALQDQNLLEICDGLGDIFYVAVGALWKMGFDPEQIVHMFDEVQLIIPAPALMTWLSISPQPLVLVHLCVSIFTLLEEYTTQTQAERIIWAICKSNDTKKVEKVAVNVKANLDKGKNYIPPTEEIKSILGIKDESKI